MESSVRGQRVKHPFRISGKADHCRLLFGDFIHGNAIIPIRDCSEIHICLHVERIIEISIDISSGLVKSQVCGYTAGIHPELRVSYLLPCVDVISVIVCHNLGVVHYSEIDKPEFIAYIYTASIGRVDPEMKFFCLVCGLRHEERIYAVRAFLFRQLIP